MWVACSSPTEPRAIGRRVSKGYPGETTETTGGNNGLLVVGPSYVINHHKPKWPNPTELVVGLGSQTPWMVLAHNPPITYLLEGPSREVLRFWDLCHEAAQETSMDKDTGHRFTISFGNKMHPNTTEFLNQPTLATPQCRRLLMPLIFGAPHVVSRKQAAHWPQTKIHWLCLNRWPLIVNGIFEGPQTISRGNQCTKYIHPGQVTKLSRRFHWHL